MEELNSLFKTIHDYLLIYLSQERKLSTNTIRSYKKALELLLDYTKNKYNCEYHEITFEKLTADVIRDFLIYLEEDRSCSVTTRNQRLHCIRSFYKYASQKNITNTVFFEDVKKIKPAKENKKLVEHMSETAIEAILKQPDTDTDIGKRDAFMMLFLYKTGARVQELVDIRLCDIHLGKQANVVLHGKGAKTRIVPLRDSEIQHLKKYLLLFHPDYTPYSQNYLFYTVRGHQKKRMTEDNVRDRVSKYGTMARGECKEVPENVHPHLFRHSLAMILYQNGVDLTLVSQWLGHANLETTLIYAHADTELKRQAIEKAIPDTNPIKDYLNAERYKISDEELLKRLVGFH